MAPALVTGKSLLVAREGEPLPAPGLRPARLARLDRLSALALLAADAALLDAGFDDARLAALPPERIALVVGTGYGCHATNEAYYRGLLAEGPRGASPKLFACTLPSSPLGELSIHFGARGAAQGIVSGGHAGLEAVARAASLCGAGRAELVIAIGVEVGGGAAVPPGLRDAAAAIVLEPAGAVDERRAWARIEGSGFAFRAGDPRAAREQAARTAAGGDGAATPLDDGGGNGAAFSLAPLVGWLAGGHEGGAGAIAVASDAGGGACALLAVATGRVGHG